MKKLSIILLALAMAAFAVPAFAGDVSVSGDYTLDGESGEYNDGSEAAWYDDEFNTVIKVNQGSVTGVLDLEVSDDETFDGSDKVRTGDLLDNYWIEWKAMDNLTFKAGEFGFTFGAAVVIYADPAAHTYGVNYAMDAADLGFYISKVTEVGKDGDNDAFTILANVKSVDFFSKLKFIFVSGNDDSADESYSYMGFDSAFAVGPVAVALEYGSVTDDDAANENDFILAQFGLDDLVGFDLNIDYFGSGEDGDLAGRFGSGDFYPYMLVGWRDSGLDDDLNDMTLIGLSASYALNDKTTLIGKVLLSGEYGANDDTIGTEIDLHAKYKLDDQTSIQLTYATLSPDDAYGLADDTASLMRARLSFKF